MITIIAAIILFIILSREVHSDNVSLDGFRTKNFNQRSKQAYDELKEAGVGKESLVEFLMMEDRLLELEKISVCQGISTNREITEVSQQIKNRFPGFDFSYHILFIKQASEPNKLIDKNLKCG